MSNIADQDPRTILANLLNARMSNSTSGTATDSSRIMNNSIYDSPHEVRSLCEDHIQETRRFIAEQNTIDSDRTSNQTVSDKRGLSDTLGASLAEENIPIKHMRQDREPEPKCPGVVLAPSETEHANTPSRIEDNGMQKNAEDRQIRIKVICEGRDEGIISLSLIQPLQVLLDFIHEKLPETRINPFSILDMSTKRTVYQVGAKCSDCEVQPSTSLALLLSARSSCVLMVVWPSEKKEPKRQESSVSTSATGQNSTVRAALWGATTTLASYLKPQSVTERSTSSQQKRPERSLATGASPRIATLQSLATKEQEEPENQDGKDRDTYDNGTNQAFFKK